jgi:hypothetical protein
MAALPVTNPTLMDVAKRLDPDGTIAPIVEILNETNPIMEDMTWVEGNLPTGHRTTIRSGLPTPTWRKLYGGVQPTKSTTVQVTDNCGMLEAYAEVDKALADLNGNTSAFRMSEDKAHIEGMNQEFVSTLMYGNEGSEPEAFTGFAPRYNDQAAANGENILTSAATPDNSDNSSIWLIGWSPQTVHGIYPKGSIAGLQMQDKGQVTIENASDYSGGAVGGGRYEAYRTHYRWDCGLSVRDWRYIVRVNYDDEDLVKDAATGPDLIDLLSQATELVPSLNGARFAFYGNRRAMSFLKRQIANKVAASTLTMETVGGKHVTMFEGIPFRRCDALLNTEAGI